MVALSIKVQLDEAEAIAVASIDRAFGARDKLGKNLHNLDNMRAAARYTLATLKSRVDKGEVTSLEQLTEALVAFTEQALEDLSNDEARSMALQTNDQGRKDQKRLYDMRRAECGIVMDSIASALGIKKAFQAVLHAHSITIMAR